MSVDNIVSLGAKRVGQKNNADNWQAVEALKKAIQDIESGVHGEVTLAYIGLLTKKDGDVARCPYYVAGDNGLAIAGLIHRHLLLVNTP